MRTVYLGTSDFAAVLLRRLAQSAHRPSLVITRPDRRRGRGQRVSSPPVAGAARDLGIALEQPEGVNEGAAVRRIAAERPEAVCVCAFGALIREPLLSSQELVNVHPSLLPRWRGAAPLERAIQAGDRSTGVSVMRLVAELDAGPVYRQGELALAGDEDCAALAARLAPLAADLLCSVLDDCPEPWEQPGAGVTYAAKVERWERELDPARPVAELARTVRALTPHIGAWVATPEGERLGVRRARVAADAIAAVPGALREDDGALLLGAADGALELLEVQPAGGRAMDAGSYLRGRVRH